jgi:hypothetical protein
MTIPKRSFAVIAPALLSFVACAPRAAPAEVPHTTSSEVRDGSHDFDTRIGRWTVHHRLLKERLAGSQDWIEFDGTQTFRPMMGGSVNVDENFIDKPGQPYQGLSLRAYDPKTGLWSIWWLDGRTPNQIEVPVRGRFENGVGTFYADDTHRGRPIRVRFLWSNMTDATAHWEQAYSADGGTTWETNWVADFARAK